jgi:hypothetical protein
MRKALIAAAVATALFAVGAFAASFAVQSEDSASGSNAVTACAQNARIEFDEGFSTSSSNWNINSITVTFTGGTPANCVGGSASLVLSGTGGAIVLQEEKVVPAAVGGVVSVTYTPTNATLTDGATPLTVAEVLNAAVLVDGLQLSTT